MRYHGVAVRRMPPADLEEKIRPGHTALVVLDVLNDFCAEGGMMDAEGADLTAVQAAAGRIPRLLAAARAAAALVVFVRNEYTSQATAEPIVTKHRYDAFLNTDLDLILRANRVDTVVLCGVATNVCVETTARAAFVRDYYVVVAEDTWGAA
jgi:ureidoacrylate peracid hydrolase